MKSKLFALLVIHLYLILIPLFSWGQNQSGHFHPRHLLISTKPHFSFPKINSKYTVVKKLSSSIYLVESDNIASLEKEFSLYSAIDAVQKDYSNKGSSKKLDVLDKEQVKQQDNDHDPDINQQWNLHDSPGINAFAYYQNQLQKPQTPTIVAVVDTGLDIHHKDLIHSLWTNSKEVPNDQIDNDGNGYIDDIYGIDLLKRDNQGHATADVMPVHYHGTHVSGVIAAEQNNAEGIFGIANTAVKIMTLKAIPEEGDELDSDIIEAFVYAAKNGARVINCSFSKASSVDQSVLVKKTIEDLGKAYGVLFVAASGNDSEGSTNTWFDIDTHFMSPASIDSSNLIVVASNTRRGNISEFSNIGKTSVDVSAPGTSIYSTLPKNLYGKASGTSMAAPHVSAVAAMILSYYPHLTPEQVKEIIMTTVTPVVQFESRVASAGRINMKHALEKAATYPHEHLYPN